MTKVHIMNYSNQKSFLQFYGLQRQVSFTCRASMTTTSAPTQVPDPLQCRHLLQRSDGSCPALAATTPVPLQCSYLLQRTDGSGPVIAETTPVTLQCSHLMQRADSSHTVVAATTPVSLQCSHLLQRSDGLRSALRQYKNHKSFGWHHVLDHTLINVVEN